MLKNLVRKIINWAQSDMVRPVEPGPVYSNSIIASSSKKYSVSDGTNGMNFTVYNAIGGKVIQFVAYDPIRDRAQASLYIVTDKEDLGEELGQIITKESLSR